MNVGSIVSYPKREWVVLPSDQPDLTYLRPLTGAVAEIFIPAIFSPSDIAAGIAGGRHIEMVTVCVSVEPPFPEADRHSIFRKSISMRRRTDAQGLSAISKDI